MSITGLVLFSIFIWSTPHNLFKLSVKIGQIAVAAVKGNIRYHFVGGGECIACRIHSQLCQMLHSAHANGFLEASHEIAFT